MGVFSICGHCTVPSESCRSLMVCLTVPCSMCFCHHGYTNLPDIKVSRGGSTWSYYAAMIKIIMLSPWVLFCIKKLYKIRVLQDIHCGVPSTDFSDIRLKFQIYVIAPRKPTNGPCCSRRNIVSKSKHVKSLKVDNMNVLIENVPEKHLRLIIQTLNPKRSASYYSYQRLCNASKSRTHYSRQTSMCGM